MTRRRWFRLTVGEAVLTAAVVSILSMVLLPAFDQARDDAELSASTDAIDGLHDTYHRQNVLPEMWSECRRVGASLGSLATGSDSRMLPNDEEFTRSPGRYRRFWQNWCQTKGKTLWVAASTSQATPLADPPGAALADLPQADVPDCDLPISLRLDGKLRTHLLGYSAEHHRLVLLEKRFRGKRVKPALAWETTGDFGRLLPEYLQ